MFGEDLDQSPLVRLDRLDVLLRHLEEEHGPATLNLRGQVGEAGVEIGVAGGSGNPVHDVLLGNHTLLLSRNVEKFGLHRVALFRGVLVGGHRGGRGSARQCRLLLSVVPVVHESERRRLGSEPLERPLRELVTSGTLRKRLLLVVLVVARAQDAPGTTL